MGERLELAKAVLEINAKFGENVALARIDIL
jgi:hypothetical protein